LKSLPYDSDDVQVAVRGEMGWPEVGEADGWPVAAREITGLLWWDFRSFQSDAEIPRLAAPATPKKL
jgi:hypothetical protein